ncbi:DUF6233 domain-containing protein [Streptomyces sp. 35G-GA-8]|uniref:DUF6233 domain-containing protein n=1 Tax=Streptomyces sp. 35G-GA-8 TaxID=2939434 RepID=UPI00201F1932|nr:DUF6233 domain-containing protein [Streptomyces sp. 35G-GA-8]MCL7382123.1 DUF6233 domain-containing protein [Streptomyces sp. 35G-GA-8]
MPRLAALRFLERVQLRDLERTRHWIAAEEGRAAETATTQPQPPPPEWVVDRKIVHSGDCWAADKRSQAITRKQAIEALTQHQKQPCDVCRPDTSLSVLD